MDRYNINKDLIGAGLVDDTSNSLALRADVHHLFDKGTFIFTPKHKDWVAHFLTPTANLGPEYHNNIIEMPDNVNTAHVLARIAWAVFPQIRNFLIRGETRLVTVAQPGDMPRIDTLELDRTAMCNFLAIPAAARSSSPKKRGRAGDSGATVLLESTRESKRLRVHESEPEPEPATLSFSSSLPSLLPMETAPSTAERTVETPELVASLDTSADGAGTTEDTRIANLRRKHLRARRPSDPRLFCCDYTAAEAAVAAGYDGPKELGGAHLCLQCLGMEVRDEFGPLEDSDV